MINVGVNIRNYLIKVYVTIWNPRNCECECDKSCDVGEAQMQCVVEEFNSSLLKIDKKSYKDIDNYYIGYIAILKIDDCENMYSVNPLYLINGKIDGHIEEKNKNKYLFFGSTDENKVLSSPE